MTKTKIEWTNHTINPISGCYGAVGKDGKRRQCEYCYAKTTAENPRMKSAFPDKFELVYHPERLKQFATIKQPSLIFIDSMGDLFGERVKKEWVHEIFEAMHATDRHVYQILTKSPDRINQLVSGDMYRSNIWLGTSVDTVWGCNRISDLQKVPQFNKFISFEPLLEKMPDNMNLFGIKWIIIGQRTKPFNNPPQDWVYKLMHQAAGFDIPVFIKNNLLDRGYLVPERKSEYQRFPIEMQLKNKT